MLLGQIIAISFASNLYFLAAIVAVAERPKATRRALPSWLWHFATIGTLVSVAAIPYVHGWDSFLVVLLLPHILLFLPILSQTPSEQQISGLRVLTVSSGVVLGAFVTLQIQKVRFRLKLSLLSDRLQNGGNWKSVWDALWAHSAVSSVGFDVIFCWISFLCWATLGPRS